MSKNEQFEFRRKIIHDPVTGRELWQITDGKSFHCAFPYFLFNPFSKGNRYAFFNSDRKGRFDLYRIEIDSGEVTQVTGDGTAIPGHSGECNVHLGRNEVFWCNDDDLFAADTASLDVRRVCGCDKPEWMRIKRCPAFTSDGKHYIISIQRRDGSSAFAVGDLDGGTPQEIFRWSGVEGPIGGGFPAPGNQMIIAVTAPGKDRQDNPALPPYAQRARTWALDANTGVFGPFLVMPPGFRATHDYWGPDGRYYFHKKTVGAWVPTWVASIDVRGGDYREHFRSGDRKLGHSCLSPDMRRLAVDVQEPGHNELFLVDMATGSSEILCWPNSSVTAPMQLGHVHPVFTATPDMLAYQTDAGGKCNLYLVPLC